MDSKEALKILDEIGIKDNILGGIKKDLEILEIFRNSGYFVTNNGDDDFELTFGVRSNDIDDFIEWKTGKKKKTLF